MDILVTKALVVGGLLSVLVSGCATPQAVKHQKGQYSSDKPVVLFILDTSGSMAAKASGERKLETAKTLIQNTISQIDKKRFNTSLITFEPNGNCKPQVSVSPNNNQASNVVARIRKIEANGKTPLAKAITLSGEVLENVDRKIVILLSDGKETCGGNPVAAAKTLDHKHGIKLNMQVIGYAVDAETKRQLEAIAEIGARWGYHGASNPDQLAEVVNTITKDEGLPDEIWKGRRRAVFEFETGSDEVKGMYQNNIRKIFEYLYANDESILIRGHTDSVGEEEFNMQLSIRRAEAVKEELIRMGINPQRIEVQGAGEESPVGSNATAEGRQRNRRVEILVRNRESPNTRAYNEEYREGNGGKLTDEQRSWLRKYKKERGIKGRLTTEQQRKARAEWDKQQW